MSRTVLLVDYENVGDAGLEKLPPHQRLLLFVGKDQKPKQDFVKNSMASGVRLDMIPVTGVGKDNLDFHLAFYLGRLVEEDQSAQYIILSKDKGFNPLARHITALGVSCQRVAPAMEVQAPASHKQPSDEKQPAPHDAWDKVVSFLKSNPPKTRDRLLNAIRSQALVSEAEAEGILAALVKKGFAVLDKQGRVSYPKSKA